MSSCKRLDCKFAKYLVQVLLISCAHEHFRNFQPITKRSYGRKNLAGGHIVCYTAVFSVVTQRSSTQREKRYVTTLKTAVYDDDETLLRCLKKPPSLG